MVILVFTVLN